jgi:hypothetical protein
MSCPRDVGATQRCVSLTSLRGRAPAFSRFGRWWRNPRLVVRPSGVGVAMVEHVVSHVFEIAIPRRASSRRGVCAIRGEAGEMARCDRDVGAVISALLAVNARPSGRVARVQLRAGARPSERSPTRRARGHAQVCREDHGPQSVVRRSARLDTNLDLDSTSVRTSGDCVYRATVAMTTGRRSTAPEPATMPHFTLSVVFSTGPWSGCL